jgi:hypothetical protein
MDRDVRAKDMQIFYQIVTHLVRLNAVQLFSHRQAVGIRTIRIEVAEVTQRIRTESASHVGTVEKAPNVIFANSDRPLSSPILDMCIGSEILTDNIMMCAISNQ